jgi:hypothetical protein
MSEIKFYSAKLDPIMLGFLEYIDLATKSYKGDKTESFNYMVEQSNSAKFDINHKQYYPDGFGQMYSFASVIKLLLTLKKEGFHSADFDKAYEELNSLATNETMMKALHRFDAYCEDYFLDTAIPHYFEGYVPDAEFCKLGFNWFDKDFYAKRNEFHDNNSWNNWYIDSTPAIVMRDVIYDKK